MERGFKTWCETYATEARLALGIAPDAPIDTRALAKSLGVRVLTPQDIPGISAEAMAVLLRNDGKTPSCWSAVTLVVGAQVAVILNSSHSPARQASDLAHELAHRVRGHEAQSVSVAPNGLIVLSSYEKVYEEEADWLSGCILLPRAALVTIKRKRLTDVQAAAEYGVSVAILRYRTIRTGVTRQFA